MEQQRYHPLTEYIELFVFRHGDPLPNMTKEDGSFGYDQHALLSEAGLIRVLDLLRYLEYSNIRFDELVCSDYTRAWLTARALATRAECVQKIPEFGDLWGGKKEATAFQERFTIGHDEYCKRQPYAGHSIPHLDLEQIACEFDRMWIEHPTPDVDAYLRAYREFMKNRTSAARWQLKFLEHRFAEDASQHKRIAIVGHMSLAKILLMLVNQAQGDHFTHFDEPSREEAEARFSMPYATGYRVLLGKHPDPYCTWPAVVAGPMPIRPRGKKSASRSTLEKVFGTRVVQTILEQEARFRSGWVA